MPERFLLQVMRSLVNQGLLHSTRGVDGGYFLARPPDKITLCNIVEAFDNPLASKLPEISGTSEKLRERVMATLQMASQAAREELERLTLSELLSVEQGERVPSESAESGPRHAVRADSGTQLLRGRFCAAG